MSSSQPTMSSLSRAHLAANGTVDSVSNEIAFDDAGVFGVALDAPVDRDPPVVTMTPTAPPRGRGSTPATAAPTASRSTSRRPIRAASRRSRAPRTASSCWPNGWCAGQLHARRRRTSRHLHRDRRHPAREQGRRHRLDRLPGDPEHRSDRPVDLLQRGSGRLGRLQRELRLLGHGTTNLASPIRPTRASCCRPRSRRAAKTRTHRPGRTA